MGEESPREAHCEPTDLLSTSPEPQGPRQARNDDLTASDQAWFLSPHNSPNGEERAYVQTTCNPHITWDVSE